MVTKHILLGSGSPRRRQLMQQLDVEFDVVAIKDVDENYPDTLPPEEVAEYLANKKSAAYRTCLSADDVLVTADTVVISEGQILGKPADKEEGVSMLKRLSGKTHQVVTGVVVATGGTVKSFSEVTEVTFRALADEEIEYYIDRYAPLDKAGAYGIQEWIGMIGVERINGCFYNVMGLPVSKLYNTLKEF